MKRQIITAFLCLSTMLFAWQAKAAGKTNSTDYAVSFDGNSSLKPTGTIPPFGATFTISGWIFPALNTSGTVRTIAAWATTSNGNVGNFFRIEGDDNLFYGQWNGSFKKARSTTQLSFGKWQHVALVKDNNTLHFYINGVESAAVYTNGTAPMDNNSVSDGFRFGGLYQSGAFIEAFKGQMNDLAFYTSARTAEQIAAEFSNGVNTSETSLWGYWDFNDKAAVATDLSGKGNTLTRMGNIVYTEKVPEITPDGGNISTGHVKNNTAHAYISSNVPGKLYWAVYPSSATNISIEQVKNGTNAVKYGIKDYKTHPYTDFWVINGLTPANAYTLYGVLEVTGTEQKLISTTFTTTNSTTDLSSQIEGIKALMQRLLPDRAAEFEFAAIDPVDDVLDVFELLSVGNNIRVSGSSGTAMAAGVRYYLNNYCNASFSWNGDQNILPATLPVITNTVRKETTYRHRYALNYCTLNYTMSFWDWERWEREIDLMATQGVNLFLSGIGTEAVWQNVMQKYGYSFSEIQKFIPGPAYTAWWLMGNLEGEGGPVSQAYIDGRVALQKKILARAEELGMEVVLQGFCGFAPTTIGSKIAGINVHDQGEWVSGYKRPVVVSGPKAFELAATWYEESIKLFGAAKYYGGDLFHEGGQIPAGLDVTQFAADIQAEMLKANPEAVWVLQSWLHNPKTEVIAGLKKDQTLVIDLGNERDNGWLRDAPVAFTNIPWVYSVIHNFGGRMGIYARLQRIADNHFAMQSHPQKGNNWGIGIAPEAIIFNQVGYDLLWDLVWKTDKINVPDYVTNFAAYRYGKEFEYTTNAWKILSTTALNCPGSSWQDGASESVVNARPALDIERASSWSTTTLYYDPKAILPAWTLMLKSANEFSDKTTYRFDLVDITRQCLVNYAQVLQKEVTAAYRAKNKALFASKSQLFLELVLDIDSLLRTREECLTGTWIADARAMGTNDTEKNLFEKNARALITTWDTKKDGSLHDYSHREWAGLTKNLYYERWKLFFSDLQGQLDGKTAKNYNYFSMLEFPWITKFSETHSTQPQGDEIEISAFLYEKYMPLMLGTDKKSFSIQEKQEAGYIAGQLNVANATNYSIQSQSVTDAFSIDNSGKITVNKAEQMLFAVHPVINLRVKAGNSTTPEFVSYTDVTINLYATTAVRNPEKVTEVLLFPNPAKYECNIRLPYEQDVKISVSDTKGKIFLSDHKSGKLVTFKTNIFPRGVYLENVSNKTLNSSMKLLLE